MSFFKKTTTTMKKFNDYLLESTGIIFDFHQKDNQKITIKKTGEIYTILSDDLGLKKGDTVERSPSKLAIGSDLIFTKITRGGNILTHNNKPVSFKLTITKIMKH